MVAGRTCRTLQASTGIVNSRPVRPPPLPHVLQPLRALLVLVLGVVPHGKIGDPAAVDVLDPQRDVGPVILDDVQSRNIDADVASPASAEPVASVVSAAVTKKRIE